MTKVNMAVCRNRGVPRNLYWGGPETRRRGGRGGGFPLPSRLGGLGERRKLPQRGKTVLVHFLLEKNTSGGHKFEILYFFVTAYFLTADIMRYLAGKGAFGPSKTGY